MAITSGQCPFCNLPPGRVQLANELALLVGDGYPVSSGHSLALPRRHIGSVFETTEAEMQALWQLLRQGREAIDRTHKPDSYNVGINDGPAAGQTVPHLHIHLIPRYAGDVADPRGGVRWILPAGAAYWEEDPS